MTGTRGVVWRFVAVELVRDRAAWMALAVLGLLALAASSQAIAAVADVRRALDEARAHAAGVLANARGEGEAIVAGRAATPPYWVNPADVRGFAYYLMVAFAIKPPTPAAALSLGSMDVLPSSVRVVANSTAPFAQAYELDNPHRLALGRVDPSFVAIYVLPLVIAALGYHVLARERQGSRLALLAVHGVDARRLVTARLVTRAGLATIACLAASLVPVWLAAGAITAASAAWAGVVVAHAAVWTAIVALVAARTSRETTAAAALGAVWVVATLVLPWALSAAAETLFPSPSRVAQILRERDGVDRVEEGGLGAVNRYVAEHPELGVAEDTSIRDVYTSQQIALNAAIEESIAGTDGALGIQLERRQALVDRLAWAVPAVLAADAMVDVAGTGWRRHRAFLAQGRDYVQALREYFDPRALRGDFVFTDWDGWPRFAWQEPAAGPALTRAALSMAGLFAVAGAIVAAAWRALARVSAGGGRA